MSANPQHPITQKHTQYASAFDLFIIFFKGELIFTDRDLRIFILKYAYAQYAT